MQNATVREYTRRCNTVENIHIYKVIGPWERVFFVRETEAILRKAPLVRSPKQVIVPIFIFPYFFYSLLSQPCSIRDFLLFLIRFLFSKRRDNYNESAACPIPKASNSSHFHIPLMFLFSTFPAMQYHRFFSLFDTFSHPRNFKNAFSVELLYQKDSNMLWPLNKVKPCCAGLVLGWLTKYECPVLQWFFFFFPLPFPRRFIKDCYEGLLRTKYQIRIYPCHVAYMNAMRNKSIGKNVRHKLKMSRKKKYPAVTVM